MGWLHTQNMRLRIQAIACRRVPLASKNTQPAAGTSFGAARLLAMSDLSNNQTNPTKPFSFEEAWQSLPFNMKLMLLHIQRAEQDPWPRVED
jgi:hypothetical protein